MSGEIAFRAQRKVNLCAPGAPKGPKVGCLCVNMRLCALMTRGALLGNTLCGVNRLGDSGEYTLGNTSAFVNPAGQLLLTRRGKTRMDGVGIVFEFYIAPF